MRSDPWKGEEKKNLSTARYAVSDNATQVWWVNKKIKNKYQSMPLGSEFSELCIKQNIRRVEKKTQFICTYIHKTIDT